MGALALSQLLEYDFLFPLIFVKSLMFVFFVDGSPFGTFPRVCLSVCLTFSACVNKNCYTSATCDEDVVTSICVACSSPCILSQNFSVTLRSSREKKSAVVFIEPAMSANLKKKCKHIHMHSTATLEGLLSVRKRVTDLLSVKTIIGVAAFHKTCANRRKTKYVPQIFLYYMENFNGAGKKNYDPNGFGTYVFRFEFIFSSGLFPTMRAYLTFLKLVCFITTFFFLEQSVSCLVGKQFFLLSSLIQMFPKAQLYYWLASLI